jgi:hypothetical protein
MIRIPFLPEGTRVRVCRSDIFPQDPEMEGRTGLVLVRRQRGRDGKVAVQLDGESSIRTFHAGELEVLDPAALDLGQAGSTQP